MDNKQRELNKQILDRIASDPKFREELLDDPRGAMERAGFKWETGGDDEVSGYGLLFTTALNCPAPKGGGGPGPITTAMSCTPGPDIDPAWYAGGTGGGTPASTALTCAPEVKPKPGADPGMGTVPPLATS